MASAWLILSVIGAFTGGVLTFVMRPSETEPVEGRWRRMVLRSLRIFLPTLGLAVSIVGITVSEFCSSLGCGTKPFRSEGILLLVFGIPVFLGGLVLLASTLERPPPPPARRPSR